MTGNPRILLLDFWSDKNRGDAAMQVALIQLVREHLPDSPISIMAAFGANQWPSFLPELDHTERLVDQVVGGIRPTFVPFPGSRWHSRPARRAAGLLSSALGILMLPIWWVVGKVRWFDCLFPRSYRQSIRTLRSADLVLWNGRNFRSDSSRRELYEIWHLLYNPMIALLFGKPIACIGASVWPLRGPTTRFLIRYVFSKTLFISLREQSSFDYTLSLLRGRSTRLELLPDLSLAVLPSAGQLGRSTKGDSFRTLGVTVVDWAGDGESARLRYREGLSQFLESFLSRGHNNEILLVPQVTYHMEATDSFENALIERLGRERVRVVPGNPTIEELIAMYGQVDLLLATRMHSAIFALSQGTPVVTIPYDEGGKWGILDMLGASDTAVPFCSVTSGALESKVDSVWARRYAIADSVGSMVPELKSRVSCNVEVPISLFLGMARDFER